jgi:hypothetical protein
MPPDSRLIETLKDILESSLRPEELDAHPWTKSLIFLDAMDNPPDLQDGKTPGQRLVFVIAKLFAEMMPSTTPRHGKRLDNRWGEFGILAAQYFAPLKFGTPLPASLRDAWGRIDQSILLFVYGKPKEMLSDTEKEAYKLVGNELEVAPNSTISDWHRKGLLRLADVILARENYLSESLSKPVVILQNGQVTYQLNDPSPASNHEERNKKNRKSGNRRFIPLLFVLFLLGLILAGGFKAWKVYNLSMIVRRDAVRIQELVMQPASRLERIKMAGPPLITLRQDFKKLKKETEPFFWMGPWLEWVPVYGGDLASVQDLATMADSLLAVADISYQVVLPLVVEDDLSTLEPSRLTRLMYQAQPQLLDAQQNLDQALTARARLNPESLSPQLRDMIVNDLDPLMILAQDGLAIGVELPRLMGATDEGPKTYLLLVQNEDELRPTGGFITAAGTLLMQDGDPSGLFFLNSGDFDNWDKPYPAAPWQLREYMNSPVLIFRDANWFTNYPTAALYAEYLYSYTSSHSVDGVIAFDQHMLVKVLSVTGPIKVEGVSYLINAENVVSYMRQAKTPTANDLASPEWNNKVFINKLTRALIAKMFSGDVHWEPLSTMLLQALEERHLLIQLDSPKMTSLLERYHWDGAVRPMPGDFLMVVDSNIGFNKTNAVVDTSLSYDVDLTDPSAPTGLLTVFHKNNAEEITFCKHWNKVRTAGEQDYPITDCYWNYLRVYTRAGTRLLNATPQIVPDNWMIPRQKNPGQVDILEEEIDGVQAYGTLKVLLGGQSLSTDFEFALPADILRMESDSNRITYHLKVQKQPGTAAVPISIRVRLPQNALIETGTTGAIVQDNNILYQANLRTDIEFDVIFTAP